MNELGLVAARPSIAALPDAGGSPKARIGAVDQLADGTPVLGPGITAGLEVARDQCVRSRSSRVGSGDNLIQQVDRGLHPPGGCHWVG
jgi:hypothetical protein